MNYGWKKITFTMVTELIRSHFARKTTRINQTTSIWHEIHIHTQDMHMNRSKFTCDAKCNAFQCIKVKASSILVNITTTKMNGYNFFTQNSMISRDKPSLYSFSNICFPLIVSRKQLSTIILAKIWPTFAGNWRNEYVNRTGWRGCF